MKPGCVAIAAPPRPDRLVRTHYTRSITIKTWDRTQSPALHAPDAASGPYWIAPDADEATCEGFRRHLENELLELTARVAARLDGDHGPHWGFPIGWTPRWAPDRIGTPYGPHDLDPEHPPPWAHRKA
jgi:hypothetical protein